eukprot:gene2588-1607_t
MPRSRDNLTRTIILNIIILTDSCDTHLRFAICLWCHGTKAPQTILFIGSTDAICGEMHRNISSKQLSFAYITPQTVNLLQNVLSNIKINKEPPPRTNAILEEITFYFVASADMYFLAATTEGCDTGGGRNAQYPWARKSRFPAGPSPALNGGRGGPFAFHLAVGAPRRLPQPIPGFLCGPLCSALNSECAIRMRYYCRVGVNYCCCFCYFLDFLFLSPPSLFPPRLFIFSQSPIILPTPPDREGKSGNSVYHLKIHNYLFVYLYMTLFVPHIKLLIMQLVSRTILFGRTRKGNCHEQSPT